MSEGSNKEIFQRLTAAEKDLLQYKGETDTQLAVQQAYYQEHTAHLERVEKLSTQNTKDVSGIVTSIRELVIDKKQIWKSIESANSKAKVTRQTLEKTSLALAPIARDFKHRQNGMKDSKKKLKQMVFNIVAMVVGTGIIAVVGMLVGKLAFILFK